MKTRSAPATSAGRFSTVPGVIVGLLFSEHPTDKDDAPFVTLTLPRGHMMLRPHEANLLSRALVDAAFIIGGPQ